MRTIDADAVIVEIEKFREPVVISDWQRGHEAGLLHAMAVVEQALSAQPDHTAGFSEMVDLIERQAAIDAVENLVSSMSVCISIDECHGMRDMKYRALKAISALPSAQPEQQWIPCSEQEYPSDNREVEVTCEFTRYDGKKYRYTCHASYVHRYSIETTYDDWEDCEEYNEEKDTYYALPGWYEQVHNWGDYSYCAIEDRVVAWRELPEPWKGEQL